MAKHATKSADFRARILFAVGVAIAFRSLLMTRFRQTLTSTHLTTYLSNLKRSFP